jgi:hypothetical protein
MLSKDIKEAFLEHLTVMLNERDYTDIDGFILDFELNDEEADELLELPVKVVEDIDE